MNQFESAKKLHRVLLLAFVCSALLPACSSTEETPSSGTSEDTSDTSDTVNCDQALTSEERQKCFEQVSK